MQIAVQHDKQTDRVMLTFNGQESMTVLWVSADEAIAIGDVGRMAQASAEGKKRAAQR
jgi:hypothetical protein